MTLKQAKAGANHNVNNGNANIQEQGEGVMVNMFQAMNIRDQVEAARRVAANACVHRRLNGGYTMTMAEPLMLRESNT